MQIRETSKITVLIYAAGILNFDPMRIDKYIWCVRLVKTRSIAGKLVSDEKVKLNDAFVKSAKTVKEGDVVSIKEIPIWRSFKILGIPKSRVGAPLVKDLIVETTSEEDMMMLEEVRETNRQNLQFGIKGRPTKKNRRNLDGFKYN